MIARAKAILDNDDVAVIIGSNVCSSVSAPDISTDIDAAGAVNGIRTDVPACTGGKCGNHIQFCPGGDAVGVVGNAGGSGICQPV